MFIFIGSSASPGGQGCYRPGNEAARPHGPHLERDFPVASHETTAPSSATIAKTIEQPNLVEVRILTSTASSTSSDSSLLPCVFRACIYLIQSPIHPDLDILYSLVAAGEPKGPTLKEAIETSYTAERKSYTTIYTFILLLLPP